MTKNQKSKTKWKNKLLSLVSGSKRDGIFKPNTATQLTVITIINWNSKVDPQNKVKQEGLPQLKNISIPSFKLKQTLNKSTWKPKKSVSRQKSFSLLPSKALSKLWICLYYV